MANNNWVENKKNIAVARFSNLDRERGRQCGAQKAVSKSFSRLLYRTSYIETANRSFWQKRLKMFPALCGDERDATDLQQWSPLSSFFAAFRSNWKWLWVRTDTLLAPASFPIAPTNAPTRFDSIRFDSTPYISLFHPSSFTPAAPAHECRLSGRRKVGSARTTAPQRTCSLRPRGRRRRRSTRTRAGGQR